MLVVEIIQGKPMVEKASRAFDISPSKVEGWADDAKRGMENALRANALEIREQYEDQPKDLQETNGERTQVDRPLPGLSQAQRLDLAGPGDRLPYPRTAGLASIAIRQGHDRRQRLGACPDQLVQHFGQGCFASSC